MTACLARSSKSFGDHHALFRTARFPGDCQKARHWRAFAPAFRSLRRRFQAQPRFRAPCLWGEIPVSPMQIASFLLLNATRLHDPSPLCSFGFNILLELGAGSPLGGNDHVATSFRRVTRGFAKQDPHLRARNRQRPKPGARLTGSRPSAWVAALCTTPRAANSAFDIGYNSPSAAKRTITNAVGGARAVALVSPPVLPLSFF